MEILTEIISILVGGLETMASGIGAGLSSLAQSIFLTTSGDTTTLSVFGTLVVIFSAVSLAIGLSRWVVNFVASLGNRNR